MVHADSATAVLARRKAFLAKWKLRCRAVADSLEEAGERLFTFLRYPPEQWRSLRTTKPSNVCMRVQARIKTQCLLPCAETAATPSSGAPGLGSDHHAPGRRPAYPRPGPESTTTLTSLLDHHHSTRRTRAAPISTTFATRPS